MFRPSSKASFSLLDFDQLRTIYKDFRRRLKASKEGEKRFLNDSYL